MSFGVGLVGSGRSVIAVDFLVLAEQGPQSFEPEPLDLVVWAVEVAWTLVACSSCRGYQDHPAWVASFPALLEGHHALTLAWLAPPASEPLAAWQQSCL
jgi:hypothetical protein